MNLLDNKYTNTLTTLNDINKTGNIFNKSNKDNLKRIQITVHINRLSPNYSMIYVLSKTHKNNIPQRPIISGLNTPLHNIAKNMIKILIPLIF